MPEERVVVVDPLLDGRAERIGADETSQLVWRRGGMVRLVKLPPPASRRKDVVRAADTLLHVGSNEPLAALSERLVPELVACHRSWATSASGGS